MSTTLRGRAFVRGRIHDDVSITFADGRILEVRLSPAETGRADSVGDGVILPGFIDAHVHGGFGHDFMDASAEGNEEIAVFHSRHGTTALAATTLSGSRAEIAAAVDAIAKKSREPSAGAEIVAIHFEGPYLNPEKSGAQDRGAIREPDFAELDAWLAAARPLRSLMTVAPEIAGVAEMISSHAPDMSFSIGHTTASYAVALAAIDTGASHFTHLFNAMPPLGHREPGVVGAALVSTETTAEIIADGIHVHPVVLHAIASLMPRRLALVTDAMRACGMPDGTYKLHDHDVQVSDGAARLADGTLAGSVLTMIQAVRNMVELAGVPLELVIPMATEVPARVLGCQQRKGQLEQGFDADLLVVSPRLEIERVFLRGIEIER